MTTATPLHRVVLAVWLVVVWVTLWGSITLANVGGGLLVAAAILIVFPPSPVRPERSSAATGADAVLAEGDRLRVRPLAVVSLAGWFVWALVVSTWQVAVASVTPPSRSKIRTEIVEVKLRSSSPVVATLVANAITLTPGTLTLEARSDPSVLSVHGMFVDDAAGVRSDVFDIERRVVAAVGTANDRAALAEPVGPSSDGHDGHDGHDGRGSAGGEP